MAKSFRKRQKWTENIYLVPIAMVLALVPIVVRYHKYTAMAKVYLYGQDYYAAEASDVMSWWKSTILIAAAVLMVLCLLFYAFTRAEKQWKWTILWIPLGIYGVMSFLSACFSDYSYFAFHGMDGLFESVWVLLAYCICTVYTFYAVGEEKTVWKIVRIYGVGLSILGLFGLIELVYKNPLSTVFGKYLIYPITMVLEYGDALELEQNLHQLFLTFYNSNYVGSYMALTMPFTFGICLGAKDKKEKIWFAILGLLQAAFLIASEARSGIFGLAAALVVLVFLYGKQVKKYWRPVLGGALVFIVAVLLMDGSQDFTMTKRMMGSFVRIDRRASYLEKVETLADCITITYNGNTIEVVYEGWDSDTPFTVTSEGETVEYTLNEENIWETKDARFTPIQFAKTGTKEFDCFDVGVEGNLWRFIDAKENGGYYYLNQDNYPEKIMTAKKAFGRNWYDLASGRGYVWAKTVPLLKDTLIFGSGPDTFYLVYPHNDYVDDRNYFNNIVNRPHNMYLQMAVQTGVISMVAFLVMIGMYLVSSFKVYLKCRDSYLSHIGKGITAGIVGYLVAGMVNDSMVGIAQVFWVLLGLGLAVNSLVKKQKEGSQEYGK